MQFLCLTLVDSIRQEPLDCGKIVVPRVFHSISCRCYLTKGIIAFRRLVLHRSLLHKECAKKDSFGGKEATPGQLRVPTQEPLHES